MSTTPVPAAAHAATGFHSILAAEMRHVELAPETRDLPGAEKKAAVISSLEAMGVIPTGPEGQPARSALAAAEAAIDAIIWAIRHKSEVGLFLKKTCCCCG